jgi:hypothetical protein
MKYISEYDICDETCQGRVCYSCEVDDDCDCELEKVIK